jgi:hypothetical protein
MIAFAKKLEREKRLLQRAYLCEEIKKCVLCHDWIEIKYIKICCMYFHKKCLLEHIQDHL